MSAFLKTTFVGFIKRRSHDWLKYAAAHFPKAWLIGKGDMDTYTAIRIPAGEGGGVIGTYDVI